MKRSTLMLLIVQFFIFSTVLVGEFEPLAYAAYGVHGGGGGHGGGFGGGHGGHFGGGGFGGGHFRNGGHFEGGVWIGPGWGLWDPFFYPYGVYPYPYYAAPTVVVPEQPQEYIMQTPQQQETGYWYYCKESRGYYPNVKSCPGGWMKVVPAEPAPDEEE